MCEYRLISGMTLDELIGQVMVVGFAGTTLSPEIIDLIRNYHVGGIILFSRNIEDTKQLLDLTRSLQAVARDAGYRYPLLITIDQENGVVRRLGEGATIFPGSMALGATGSQQLVREIARATGRELKALGVNMNLAPVVDVNNNPANPVIGIRSFGEDPELVARLTEAAVQGYRDAGMITCLKHFPGHGDTAVDSHRFLPVISHTLERLEEVELVPFRRGIAAGAESVMIAHIYLPQIMQQEGLGATASPTVVRGLLREELGFAGVIVSDCMEMSAVLKTLGTERGTVMALLAGIDLVLISHVYERQIGSIRAIKEAIASGELAEDVIFQAAERILRMKEQTLSWGDMPASELPEWVGGKEHAELSRQVYESSVTVVRNDDELLPLETERLGRVLVLYPAGEQVTLVEDRAYGSDALLESMRRRHTDVRVRHIPLRPHAEERVNILVEAFDADVVIMVTMNAHLHAFQAELMRELVLSGSRVIGLAVYNPYDLTVFPQLRTYLATYECTPPALEAAVRVLFGEVDAQGQLPVSIAGLYNVGDGLGRKSLEV